MIQGFVSLTYCCEKATGILNISLYFLLLLCGMCRQNQQAGRLNNREEMQGQNQAMPTDNL